MWYYLRNTLLCSRVNAKPICFTWPAGNELSLWMDFYFIIIITPPLQTHLQQPHPQHGEGLPAALPNDVTALWQGRGVGGTLRRGPEVRVTCDMMKASVTRA